MKKNFHASADIKKLKKAKLLNEIKTGVTEAKSIRSGKATGYTISDLLKGA